MHDLIAEEMRLELDDATARNVEFPEGKIRGPSHEILIQYLQS